MPTVRMPDGSTAQFPDGMSVADMQSAIETHLAQASRPAGLPPGVDLPALPAHPAVSMQSSILAPSAYGKAVGDTVSGLTAPLAHPINSILSYSPTEAIKNAGNSGPLQSIINNPDKGAGIANAVTQVGTGLAMGAAFGGAAKLGGGIKNLVRGPVDQPIVGTNLSPASRYASAQRLGVNLDAADATNSPILKGVKKINENSLLGNHLYEHQGASNAAALHGATDSFLDSLYPGNRETGGAAIQDALKANQEGLHSKAQTGFDSLPQDVPIPGLAEVGKTAQQIGQENSAYQNLFPSLKPNKAMNVVGDVGGLGPKPPAPVRMSPFIDESGAQIPSASQPPSEAAPSFSTGQKLRSDLLDFTRNNPDIVQNQGNGFIQRLAGQTDDALTNASSSLTPEQLETFRNSNAAWKDMKAAYDDPSSPLYHAVRTDNPSTLYSGIGSKTPEMARNLQTRLGPSIGPLQRGTIESVLKPNAEGAPNFKTFGTQLNRIPADYRAQLFSPEQANTIGDIANTANVLKIDSNPSGSGKLAQQVAEGASLLSGHPTGLLPVLQYPVAKFMTSPRAVNWLMRPSVIPAVNPGAAVFARGALNQRN